MGRWSAGTLLGVIAIALMGFGLTGCGGLDTGDVESDIQAEAEERLEAAGNTSSVEGVSCPDEIDAETGTTFECTLEFSDGSTATVPGEVTDGDAGEFEFTIEPN